MLATRTTNHSRVAPGRYSPTTARSGSHRADGLQASMSYPFPSTKAPGRGVGPGAAPFTRRRRKSEYIETRGERAKGGWASSSQGSAGDGRNIGDYGRFGATPTAAGEEDSEQHLSKTAIGAVRENSSNVTKHEPRRTSLGSKARRLDGSDDAGILCLPRLTMLLCCIDRGTRLAPIEVELDEGTQALVEKLQVSNFHLSKLEEVFDSLNTEASGERVECSKILTHVGMLKSPFTDHVFEIVGADPDGAVTFCELCFILMTYCVYSRDEILYFVFRQYDIDESGAIDDSEFRELAKAVNDACPMFPGSFSKAVREFDANSDGQIDFDEFRAMDKAFPLLFFPAFRMQDTLQAKFLGRDFWLKIQEGLAARRKASGALKPLTTASTMMIT